MHHRSMCFALVVFGCDGDRSAVPDASAPTDTPQEAVTCQPPVTGAFQRRDGNPTLHAGATFSDGKLDTAIADPDVFWNADAARFELYYMATHGTSFSDPGLVQQIRHATSRDARAWTVADAPALAASRDVGAWDHDNTETPTVVFDPDAPADRRYLMLYSGANGGFPDHPFPAYAIGAAFSADGTTFTRVAASESPHGEPGLVLTGKDVYPGAGGALVADPEVIVVGGTYHLFFSSFACTGASCATVTDFGVGHATSRDGIHWTVAEAPVRSLLRVPTDRATGGAQPTALYDPARCVWELWLVSDSNEEKAAQPVAFNNMAGVWHADSSDGATWRVDFAGARDLTWNPSAPGEPLGLLTGAAVAPTDDGVLLLYVGFDDQNVPSGFFLPDHTPQGFRPGVMVLDVATRGL